MLFSLPFVFLLPPCSNFYANSSREASLPMPFVAVPFDVPCSFSEGRRGRMSCINVGCASASQRYPESQSKTAPSPISFLPPSFLQNVYINTSRNSYPQTDLGPRDIRGREELDPGSSPLSFPLPLPSLSLFPKCTTVALLYVCDTVNIFF